ncbi:carotenoid biosynthesis protein [Kurthia sibirica]|nr:carotenoid biosynthesis protein [Kurthia sibirica]GEK33372.1 hypothetical protein KSI01_09050 [Kurthia sibirica]
MFLILSGSLSILYALYTFGSKKGIMISGGIFFTTFTIEGLSAHFDIFFGNYDYTPLFPPLLFGVPIGIGFAWITMIMAGHALTIHIKNRLTRSVIAAFYVVALDLILDPVAYIVKGYWIWDDTSFYYDIPLSNFLGWFTIAFCWQLLLTTQKNNSYLFLQNKIIVVFWTIAILFIWIALLNKLFLAFTVSMIAFVLTEFLRRSAREKK